MRHQRTSFRLPLALVVAVAILVAGCSSGTIDTTTTSTATTTVPVTTTSTTTTVADRPDAWDLVALGDSTPTGYGPGLENAYTIQYAALLERDLSIDVIVHDYSSNATRTVAYWAELVQESEALRGGLSQAEVVTIWLGWHDVISLVMGLSDWSDAAGERIAAASKPMPADFDNLLAAIFGIVPADAHVLIADVGIPPAIVEKWSGDAHWPEMKQAMYDIWREGIIEAAETHGATVIHTYHAINGPSGDSVIHPEHMQPDGLHFNRDGHAFLAELHRAEDGLTDS